MLTVFLFQARQDFIDRGYATLGTTKNLEGDLRPLQERYKLCGVRLPDIPPKEKQSS